MDLAVNQGPGSGAPVFVSFPAPAVFDRTKPVGIEELATLLLSSPMQSQSSRFAAVTPLSSMARVNSPSTLSSTVLHKKTRFTKVEDDHLIALVGNRDKASAMRSQDWRDIGEAVGKSSKQCRERWCNVLDPGLVHLRSKWTEEELDVLFRVHGTMGNRWSKIAQTYFLGRSENSVKNAYYAATRRVCRQFPLSAIAAEAESEAPSPAHAPAPAPAPARAPAAPVPSTPRADATADAAAILSDLACSFSLASAEQPVFSPIVTVEYGSASSARKRQLCRPVSPTSATAVTSSGAPSADDHAHAKPEGAPVKKRGTRAAL